MATRAKAATEPENEIEDLPTWRFDTPRTLVGHVTKIRSVTTKGINDTPLMYPLLFVVPEGESKEVLVHAYPESLLNELRRERPAPGDPIEIVYLGKKTTKQNREARIFEVNPGNQAAVDWSQFDGADELGF